MHCRYKMSQMAASQGPASGPDPEGEGLLKALVSRAFACRDTTTGIGLVAAVAAETSKGRRLIVATTDLDKQETVLWDMGAIAARGGA